MLFVKHPDMIKLVTIRDFDHFQDQGFLAPEINKMEANDFGLANLKGDHWRSVKASVSPAFSLKNMKAMVPTIDKNSKRMVQNLNDSFKSKKLNPKVLELDPLIKPFAMDVITQVAFGVDVNAIENPDNEFTKFAGDMFSISRFMLASMFPKLAVLFNVGIIRKDILQFFLNVSRQILRDRQSGIDLQKHNDVLDLMIKIKNRTLKADDETTKEFGLSSNVEANLDDEVIAKTMMQFFLDGYDTVAGAIVLCLYFLACNEDIQEKAHEEVNEVASKCGGNLTGDDVNDLKYLDMIFSETMRFTPMPMTARLCTKPWKIPHTDITIPKETRVFIPVSPIHMDSKFYSNPEKFDPDRFRPDRKGELTSGTYLPFGIGPRQCIGMKLARMEAKILMFNILQNFILEPCAKTLIPLKLDPNQFIQILGGCWLKFSPRE